MRSRTRAATLAAVATGVAVSLVVFLGASVGANAVAAEVSETGEAGGPGDQMGHTGEATDQLPADALGGARSRHGGARPAHRHGGHHHRAGGGLGKRLGCRAPSPSPESDGIAGIDSLANFDVQLDAPGFAADGTPQTTWLLNMVGNPPARGGTTVINAPIIPVSVDLLDVDGALRVVNGVPLHSDVTSFIQPTLDSPLFQSAAYSSSQQPTQLVDAIQRAQFFHRAPSDWHTLLAPVVRSPRTLAIPFGSYRFGLATDGNCCAFVVADADVVARLLFPPDADDTTTPIGAAENAGEITTADLAILLLPNTFLYTGTAANCCVTGFHSYDYELGAADNDNRERRFVVTVASWISPGQLAGGEDVSALGHELAEAINDPFVGSDGVHNVTPWWVDSLGVCQNKNEVADVVQSLPGALLSITTSGMTYHPQSVALSQWFQTGLASDAIDGAYSYPDESLLTSPTPLRNPLCQ